MSKTVDERVVSLQLDNKGFESNAKTSMNTLDKLKDKLNFKGLSKGVDSLDKAVKSVDMSGMGKGIEAVHAKFSALEVMGVTALANITNSAVNAGKRIASALTIDPIKTGFQEYETQINAVQTILANTESKGSTLDDVNKALEELNKYADQTIYNFTEMTRNIGTFTAAGVDLETSTNAIKGIANLAAVSGSTSQQASTAMYQLSQAMASGSVKLMDWNSVVNAGMGGQVFQDALKETARVHGVSIDSMIDKQGSFRETLKDGWLTTDILTETLQKFTLTTEGLTEEQIKANREMLKSKGYTDEQIEGIFKLGNTATNAATKVKTFTQLWDVMKESAQSGWAQTWKLIVGDFEEAKNLLTPLADFFVNALNKISDTRNTLLESALGKKLTTSFKGINKVLETTTKSVSKITGTLEDLGVIVDDVILGKFGNGADRLKKLTDAGHNYYRVQNKVNESLGCAFRYTDEQIAKQDKLLGVTTKVAEKTGEQADEMTNLSEADKKHLITLAKMTDEQLRAKNYTEDQIDAIRELRTQADKLGLSIEDFINNIENIDGRWLLIDSFKNMGESIMKIFDAIKGAWQDTFKPIDADTVYNLIEKFHELTEAMIISDEAAANFKKVFEGLFAIFQLGNSVFSMSVVSVIKIAAAVLELFGTNLLEVAANIADYIIGFRDYVKEHTIFIGHIDKLANIFKALINGISKIVKAFLSLTHVQSIAARFGAVIGKVFGSISGGISGINLDSFCAKITEVTDRIAEWIKSLENSDNLGRDLILGIIRGLKNGIVAVGKTIVDLAVNIWESFCDFFGIASPSKKMKEAGGYLIEGLVQGIQNGAIAVWNVVKKIGSGIIDIIKKIDFGAVLAAGFGVGLLYVSKQLIDVLDKFSNPFDKLGSLFGKIGNAIEDSIKASKLEKKSKTILNFAIAIGILTASLYVLTKLDTGKLWGAIGAIAALSAILVILALAVSKLNDIGSIDVGKGGLKATKVVSQIVPIALSLLLVGLAVKQLAGLGRSELEQGMIAVATLSSIIIALMAATNLLKPGIDKAGGMLLRMSVAILLLVFTAKQLSKLDPADMTKGMAFLTVFGAFIVGLIAATKLGGAHVNKLGGTIFKIAASILLLVFTARIIATMDPVALAKGAVGIVAFGAIIAGLIWITKLASGEKLAKVGSTIIAAATAMLIMSASVRILGGMDAGALVKGELAVAGLAAMIAGLIYVTKYAGKDLKGMATTLISVSIAIGTLAVVAVLLGLVKLEHLAKGIIAVGLLVGLVSLLVKSTKGAQDCMRNLIVLTVAIGILVGAIVGLSFIDPQKVATASLAIASVVGMFAILVKASSTLSGAKGMIGAMAVMLGAVVILAGVITALAKLEVGSALGAAASLSILLIAVSASLVILSAVGKFAKDALMGVLALTAMAVPLLAFVGILALMQGVNNAITNATALTMLTTALSLMLIPLSLVGVLIGATGGTALLGVVGLLAMAVPLVAFVGILALMQNIQNAEQNTKLLTSLMTTMTAVLVVLAIVGPLASIGVTAMQGLMLVMVEIGVLVTAIGALMEKFPALERFLDTGIPILEKLANAIGSILGNVISGFLTGVTSGLPEVGTKLSEFMTNVTPFIDGAKKIDDTVIKGVGCLAGAIIALTVADLISGLSSFLSFGSSFAQLGTELSMFMMNAMPFIMGARLFTPEMGQGVKTLAETILILTAADVINGLTSWFTGGSSLATFGSQLAGLGTNMNAFVTNLGVFDETKVQSVTCAANAIKALAEAATTLPNEGGWLGAIVGENSLASFGAQLSSLGTNLATFASNLGTFDDTKVKTVDCASKAIKAMAEAASEIPNDGGMASWFAGENSIATFGANLPNVGTHLASFVSNLGTFDDSKVKTVECATNAIKAMAEAADSIPNEGGMASWFAGENSIATFGANLPAVGTHLASFAANLGTFGADKVATVNSAVKAIKAFAGLAEADLKGANKQLPGFGDKLAALGSDIADFCSNMPAIDAIDAAISGIKKVISVISDIASANAGSVADFSKSLSKIGQDGVNKFVAAFKDSEDKVKNVGKKMLDKLIEGAESKKTSLTKKAKSLASDAVTALRDKYTSFYNAGSYLVDGFAAGISANDYKAEAKAAAMAKAAADAAEKALDINSPSKVFRKIGTSVPEGFVQGIERMTGSVSNSSESMASSAISTAKNALSRITAILSGDMNSQPTIRPVLDLTNVQAGANAISGMLSGRRTLAVDTGMIGSISASMSGIQNGYNSNAIVSNLKALRKDIANMPRNTYSVNGITYDDGSNVSEAIQTLIRAARVERRV